MDYVIRTMLLHIFKTPENSPRSDSHEILMKQTFGLDQWERQLDHTPIEQSLFNCMASNTGFI